MSKITILIMAAAFIGCAMEPADTVASKSSSFGSQRKKCKDKHATDGKCINEPEYGCKNYAGIESAPSNGCYVDGLYDTIGGNICCQSSPGVYTTGMLHTTEADPHGWNDCAQVLPNGRRTCGDYGQCQPGEVCCADKIGEVPTCAPPLTHCPSEMTADRVCYGVVGGALF